MTSDLLTHDLLSAIAEPAYHHVLTSGDYLVDAALRRPLSSVSAASGLAAMGWDHVVLDTCERFYEAICTRHEACRKSPQRGEQCVDRLGPSALRFVGRVAAGKTLRLRSTPELSWAYVERLDGDPFSEELRLTLYPFTLERGAVYEARFLARVKTNPDLSAVTKDLAEACFGVQRLVRLRQNMRIPGFPGISWALWHGRLRWNGPMSLIHSSDPFFFEDLILVPPPPEPAV